MRVFFSIRAVSASFQGKANQGHAGRRAIGSSRAVYIFDAAILYSTPGAGGWWICMKFS
jgi:hypothetical protein